MCYYGNMHSKIQDYLKQYEKEWTRYYWNEFVLKNENKIEWKYLSKNPNITWEIVKDNLDKPWNWNYLSANPNITLEIVKDNPDKPWDWCGGLSLNTNITWEIVKDNPKYHYGNS